MITATEFLNSKGLLPGHNTRMVITNKDAKDVDLAQLLDEWHEVASGRKINLDTPRTNVIDRDFKGEQNKAHDNG